MAVSKQRRRGGSRARPQQLPSLARHFPATVPHIPLPVHPHVPPPDGRSLLRTLAPKEIDRYQVDFFNDRANLLFCGEEVSRPSFSRARKIVPVITGHYDDGDDSGDG